MDKAKWGVLLINLGTPTEPTPKAVGTYLKEFLLDPEVIDIPWLFRQLLVRLIIVPLRKFQSALLYQKVWTPEGSPLLVHTQALTQAVQHELSDLAVEFAFRYGDPSIPSALQNLKGRGAQKIFVLPLYPQYATSATRTVGRLLRKLKTTLLFEEVRFIPHFHLHEFYLEPTAQLIKRHHKMDSHLLLSFHSLPLRQIYMNHEGCRKCLETMPCLKMGEPSCYRRQCYETAQTLAEKLKLGQNSWSVSFQSRLGRAEWLTPSTENSLPFLPPKHPDLTVAAPGFISDCLETLHELDHQDRDLFMNAGGRSYTRVPCLNTDPVWVSSLTRWIRSQLSEVPHGTTPP